MGTDPAYETALRELYARAKFGIKLGLDGMHASAERLGNPHESYATLHVAGTNGKGSVSAMLESIARASGLKTGLYTSPHLHRFAERIRIDGEPVADDVLVSHLQRILSSEPDRTFFEVATLAAFSIFREAKVDLAVIEVGLGGRLDATNILSRPRVSVVTRIALDHTDRLGGTLEAIAGEKAGILKKDVPVVLGPMSQSVREVFVERAKMLGSSVHDAPNAGLFVPSLAGAHQRTNASIAETAARIAGLTAIEEGITRATWPGRLELIQLGGHRYLLDAAHNPDGAEALAKYVASVRFKNPTLVFGSLADKDWAASLKILAPLFSNIVYVAPQGRTPARFEDLQRVAPGKVAPDVPTAISIAQALGSPVVVAGSIYLVGETRAHLLGVASDPVIAM